MTDFEKRVSDIALAGMRVTGEDQSIQDFNDYLKKSGFQKIEIENLTQKIMPNLKRLAKISKLYFTHPLLLKILNFTIAEDARINGISGYLMDLTFDGERIHGYYRITAKKQKGSPCGRSITPRAETSILLLYQIKAVISII